MVARWLALFEAQAFAVEYSAPTKKNGLPYNFADLLDQLAEIRSLRRASGESTRINTSDDLVAFMVEQQPKQHRAQWLYCIMHFCFTDEERQANSAHFLQDKQPKLQMAAAVVIAEKFFSFVTGCNLESALEDLDPYHLVTLALFHSQLPMRKQQSRPISRGWQHAQQRNTCAGR